MRYEILIDEDAVKLEKQVNEYIAEGWEPLGGVAIYAYSSAYADPDSSSGRVTSDSSWGFAQAMVKK